MLNILRDGSCCFSSWQWPLEAIKMSREDYLAAKAQTMGYSS